MSKYSVLKGLCYVIDSKSIPDLIKINQYKNYEKLDENPVLGEYFIFYDPNRRTYYRAIKIVRNKSLDEFKAYLLDTGEVVYVEPAKNHKMFYMPQEFLKIQAMSFFCTIDKFPEKYQSKLNFMEKVTKERLKFTVKTKALIANDIRAKNLCLVVDVESVNDKPQQNDQPQNQLKKANLFHLNNPMVMKKFFTAPLMASKVLPKTKVPTIGSQVIIYPEIATRPNLIYGRCKEIAACYTDNEKFTSLAIKMNAPNIQYVNLKVKPLLNEMVIVSNKDKKNQNSYYRGQVHEIFDDICMVNFFNFNTC